MAIPRLFLLLPHCSLSSFFVPHGLWDLSSLTRDWTYALCSGSAESKPLDHQEVPSLSLKYLPECFIENMSQNLSLTHSISEVLVFDNREWSLPAIVKQKVGLYYFPRNSDHEAAYSYSSVMFLHYHATAWGIKAFLLFFFLLVATFMLILSIATWHTCLSGYWRMI